MDDLDGLNRRVDDLERQFREAFPEGDYSGHRRYHEIQIELLLARRKLIADIEAKTIGGLVWSIMLGIGLAVWHWIISQVRGAG